MLNNLKKKAEIMLCIRNRSPSLLPANHRHPQDLVYVQISYKVLKFSIGVLF